MNKKLPLLTPRLPETVTGGQAQSLRTHRAPGHPAIVAELTVAQPGNTARAAVDSEQEWGPFTGAVSENYTLSFCPAVKEWHCRSARRVAA